MVLRRGGSARSGAKEHTTTPWDLMVVGLGNPGPKYRGTLHNVGVEAIELIAERTGSRFRTAKESALVAETRLGPARVALVFPQTYMNESGRAVAPLVKRYGITDLSTLVVVHDELDLEPGRMKVKFGGGLAGHNGLRSIKAHLHSDGFTRIRIGVGKPPGGKDRGVDHVLAQPTKRDRELISVCVHEAADAVEMILTDGVEAAMGRYNQK
ncbi:MAG TPA: aminoacyl-tRNA hydrolase [Microthrixaceae bacterium]|nr:aminoacyl-tRNA hydrolase [Microthrixaceae bacterium]